MNKLGESYILVQQHFFNPESFPNSDLVKVIKERDKSENFENRNIISLDDDVIPKNINKELHQIYNPNFQSLLLRFKHRQNHSILIH
jgi:hypothetical protein